MKSAAQGVDFDFSPYQHQNPTCRIDHSHHNFTNHSLVSATLNHCGELCYLYHCRPTRKDKTHKQEMSRVCRVIQFRVPLEALVPVSQTLEHCLQPAGPVWPRPESRLVQIVLATWSGWRRLDWWRRIIEVFSGNAWKVLYSKTHRGSLRTMF